MKRKGKKISKKKSNSLSKLKFVSKIQMENLIENALYQLKMLR